MKISLTSIFDKLIWLLTTILFASFYTTNANTNGMLILLGIIALVVILTVVRYKGIYRVKVSAFHYLVLTFICFCFVSSLWARDGQLAITKGITIAEILVCMSALFWYYMQQPSSRTLLKIVMWGGYFIAAYTVFVFGLDEIQKHLTDSTRLETDFANINGVAMVLAMAITISVHFWIYEGFSISTLLVVPAVVLLAASESRTALVQAIFGIVLVIVIKIWSGNKFSAFFKTLLFVGVAVILLFAIVQLPIFDGMMDRMEGLFASITGNGNIDNSTNIRNRLTSLGLRLFLKYPIAGVGIDNGRTFTVQVIGESTYLHNNYIEMLACGGMLGFVSYYGIYAYLLTHFIRKKNSSNHLGKAIVVMLLSLLLADIGTVSYYDKSTYFYFMIAFLYLEELVKTRRNENANPKDP
jgi:O-antigen ligase